MKLNNYQIFSLLGTEIPTILQLNTSIKLKYLLNKIDNSLRSNFEAFSTVRLELFKRYSTKDEGGQDIILYNSPEFNSYSEELDAIGKDEADIDVKVPL